jgi:hypothetical protein
MTEELKRTYLALLIPAVLAVFLAYAARTTGLIPVNRNISLSIIAPCVFVLSVAFAVALPIFVRSLFAHRMRNQKTVPEAVLIKFERKVIFVSLLTPYLILPAYLLDFPNFYFTATVLMALYAVYYFYPSVKRIQFEMRLFRVK